MTLPVYDPAHWVQSVNGVPVTSATAHTLKWDETLEGQQVGLSKHYSSVAAFTAAVNDGATYEVAAEGHITRYVSTDDTTTTKYSINTTGVNYVTTTKEIEAFRVCFSAPALYRTNKKGYKSTTVSLRIYYKKHTDTLWTCLHSNFCMSGKTSSEVLAYKSSPKLDYAIYDILVFRNTEDHTGDFNYRDEVYLKEVTEIVYSKIRYNHTALLGLKIRATDQLSGSVPTVTSLVQGLKVAVPEGVMKTVSSTYVKTGDSFTGKTTSTISDTSTTASVTKTYSVIDPTLTWNGHLTYEEGDPTRQTKYYSQNPVWCLWDLLTNTRYGMGNYYKIDPNKRGIILANFFIAAKYCDELVTYTAQDGSTQQRPRFTLNIVLDQSKTAQEWINAICSIMRASVYYTEGLLWIDIDRPKLVSQIFNMTSIKEYSQTGTSYRSIPNAYEVQWVNPDSNYTLDSFRLESKELQRNTQLEERKKALLFLGVTDFEQAKCLANYALLAGQYRTKTVTFKTNTNGLRCMVNDVVGIQHDVPAWGWGGIVKGYDADTRTITLSAPHKPISEFTDSDGSTVTCVYYINYAPGVGSPVEAELSKTNWDGTERYTAVLKNAPTTEPSVGDAYVIGEQHKGKITKFRIVSIKRDSDEYVEITAVEYDEQLYSLADQSDSLGEWVLTDYSFLDVPTRSSVQGVLGSTRIYQDAAGNYCTGVEILYTPPTNNSFWKSANLYYAPVGEVNYSVIENDTSGSFWVTGITDPGDYQFIVASNFKSGKQSIQDALDDWDKHPYLTLKVEMFAPNEEAMAGVGGLAVQNMANDGTFTGKDCVVVWNATSVIDATTNYDEAGSEVQGAGTTATDTTWLGYYQVVIRDLNGYVRRTERVTGTQYTYTSEMNHTDGNGVAIRSFEVEVTTYDRLGRASAAKSITVNNPAPAALA